MRGRFVDPNLSTPERAVFTARRKAACHARQPETQTAVKEAHNAKVGLAELARYS